jgi:acyl carrier protein
LGFVAFANPEESPDRMDDVARRLTKCFQVVFPDLPEAKIAFASQSSVETWDSIATVTLGNVVEEEFSLEMDFEILPELNSFDRMLAWVRAEGKVS